MEVVNKIIGGVHSDNDPHYQPENTMRRSRDGVIMEVSEGNYIWQTIKGTSISISIESFLKILGWCIIRDRYIVLMLNVISDTAGIYELNIDSSGVATTSVLWIGSNTDLNLSVDYPIRAMFGFYESQEIQRIYVTDDHSSPWTLNIGYEDPLNKLVTVDPKFLPFSPEIEQGYGSFYLLSVIAGGFVRAGNVFFTWRYVHENYYSDWSYLSNPVSVSPGLIGDTPDLYQQAQGGAPDEVTTKAISFVIQNLDDDYSSIQIAAFYSNDYNSAEPGVIFYDGDLTGQNMYLTFKGNENAGTVTIDELLETSVYIEKCKDMTPIKRRNTMFNVKLREELDVSGLNTAGKNNQIDCKITMTNREVILDVTGYPGESWSAGHKGLFRSPVGSIVSTSNTNMYCGIQYIGITNGGADLDDGGSFSWLTDEIFTIQEKEPTEGTGAICTSGTCKPVVAIKRYRKASAGPTPAWDDYEWGTISLENEFLDFKSPVISHMLRSYPGGETVRLGIVCFDLTGRPFYARWLNNKDATLGTGDVTIPKRNNQSGNEPLIVTYDAQGNDIYDQVNGNTIGLKISNLDLTDIIDDISSFMIVRVPIVHQYLGMGLLKFTHELSNNVYCAPGYRESGSDTDQHPGTYALFCPEDMFGLKDFIIQPGDIIENLQYIGPCYPLEAGETSHEGYGRPQVPNIGDEYNLYQKFYELETTTEPEGTNSALYAEHEVLYATKYGITDDDVAFDPRNEVLRYRLDTYNYDTMNRYGVSGNHNILVLDIDEEGGSHNTKGDYNRNSPLALLCSIKREVVSPYGGISDSGLANSLYIGIGHFQAINANVKADIISGGQYIFNEIEVFGGDSFISLMDMMDVMVDVDLAVEPVDHTGHGTVFPVESRMNLATREGNTVAKNRAYESVTNPAGLRKEVGYNKYEEFNYNDGYSSDDINDYYLPIPYNTTLLTQFDTQIRHSPQKTIGERQDQFRVFNTNDKIEVGNEFGKGMNIRTKFNRLIYWQEDAVGYIPVHERALTQGQFGDPVQLGVGGLFERYDEMTDKIGNSNQFGLVESDMGFHWYDAKRKMFISLTESLKFSQDSVAKGLNNWFDENIDHDIFLHDNPQFTYGICGGYDPYHKVVFYAFHNPVSGLSKTIGYDIRNQKYIGEFPTMPGGLWIRHRNFLFSQKKGTSSIYVHGKGTDYTIYGTSVTPEIQIVIKSQDLEQVIFDNYEIIGNDKFFETITVANSDQSYTETIQQFLVGQYRFLNGNYEYRNRRWYGNFPKVSRERLVDGYLIVTFKAFAQLTKFLEMKTTVRKAY